jgi:hypothetical protein
MDLSTSPRPNLGRKNDRPVEEAAEKYSAKIVAKLGLSNFKKNSAPD